MPELSANAQIDGALSRLIELTPYTPVDRRQHDWDTARNYLRRRLAGTSLHHVYDSDDLMQECWNRAHAAKHTWNGKGPLSCWFFKIAYRLILDELRRKANVALVPYEDQRIPEQFYEDDSQATVADASCELALLRDWIRDNHDDDLLHFLDALIEQLNCRKPRTRMQFVMNRLGLQETGQYKALYERLKRASAQYPKRFEMSLSF